MAESQSLASHEVAIPAPPETLECKTTWVFPSERFEELVEASVMNRYGNKGPVLEVEPSEQRDGSLLGTRSGYNLVYCKTLPCRDGSIHGVNEYVQSAKFLVDTTSQVTNPEGHLVIRSKDAKVGDETISPALLIWRLPGESFRLREIIVLAHQPADKTANQVHDLQITHEFLLVYQKREDDKP